MELDTRNPEISSPRAVAAFESAFQSFQSGVAGNQSLASLSAFANFLQAAGGLVTTEQSPFNPLINLLGASFGSRDVATGMLVSILSFSAICVANSARSCARRQHRRPGTPCATPTAIQRAS